ncbi:hypothetical protein Ngar_c29090 [Candidatus Nitrososphaera gargensis Ga9.2]|uniref:Uncharacterized protein n=1 Tax=Nitrososphaera gargensis (strain Ga9.2) TaxID=1237085 RepID=K0IKL2_NITGG|nr:helix-turn-helix transcriptional regulator [Candidatus Nitrososphaera gargensis]AFU59828.1 hypothetical protein Ngar_c29090 [Candidatus Nitrososphaera gargensis Ga9.2]
MALLEILSSGARKLILEELAKDDTRPVSAYALAKVSGYTQRTISEECKRLARADILKPVKIGEGQNGYVYNDNPIAQGLRSLILDNLQRMESNSVVEKIAKNLRMTDYYISLPLGLKVSYDVFYVPNYLLVIVDKNNTKAVDFLENIAKETKEGKVIVKKESLWGREYKFDANTGASIASIEQAMADGLEYYQTVKDTEVIRVLLARTSSIDIKKLNKLSDIRGASRAYRALSLKDRFLKDYSSKEFQKRAIRNDIDGFFSSDLKAQILPTLFPNETYRPEQIQMLNNALPNFQK